MNINKSMTYEKKEDDKIGATTVKCFSHIGPTIIGLGYSFDIMIRNHILPTYYLTKKVHVIYILYSLLGIKVQYQPDEYYLPHFNGYIFQLEQSRKEKVQLIIPFI